MSLGRGVDWGGGGIRGRGGVFVGRRGGGIWGWRLFGRVERRLLDSNLYETNNTALFRAFVLVAYTLMMQALNDRMGGEQYTVIRLSRLWTCYVDKLDNSVASIMRSFVRCCSLQHRYTASVLH